MAAADVPTALAHVCTTMDEVEAALDALGAPHVVKDDGLAAGKGVVVTDSREVAVEHARACLAKPDGRLVVEEFLDGPEVSVFCISDGETVVALAPAQDFKRVGDDDAGPNTGGMGAYSPLDWAPDGLADDIVRRVAQPTIDEMRRRGTPFVGVLYVGLALTSRGPRVIEFNARFGDPDGQASLARLETPVRPAAARRRHRRPRRLRPAPLVRRPRRRRRRRLGRLPRGARAPATRSPGSTPRPRCPASSCSTPAPPSTATALLVSAGGRVLDVVAVAPSLAKARQAAYDAVAVIELDGSHHRTDIALRPSAATSRSETHDERARPSRLRARLLRQGARPLRAGRCRRARSCPTSCSSSPRTGSRPTTG